MAVQTGRTVNKFLKFILGDVGNGTLRQIPISGLSALGVTYDEVDLTAFMDAVKGSLPNMPDAPIDIHGPFDTTDAAVVASLSGSHTVISGLIGSLVPVTVDIQFGMRHAWETGEPNFGITATTSSGYLLSKYVVNDDMTYDASFRLFPGSSLPAFGSSDETT